MIPASQVIDQLLNRYTGIYQGLSPKSPKRFEIPLFIEVKKETDSLVGLVEKELRRNFRVLKFRKPLVVSGRKTWKIAGERIFDELPTKHKKSYNEVGSNNISEVETIVENSIRMKFGETPDDPPTRYDERYGKISRGLKKFDIIYAVGGGRVIDVAKLAAHNLNIPWISIPTSLSNDGFASQFAVINLNEDGIHTLKANVPLGVIVDISLIQSKNEGYERRIRSGIGDLLSNITATFDWELAAALPEEDPRHESIDPIARSWAFNGAEKIMQQIIKKESIFYDENFLQDLAVSLIMSAEAMGRYSSSRPASGFEHKLYHMYNKLNRDNSKATHGEIVAIGSLFSSYAYGKRFQDLIKSFEKVGLPTSSYDLHNLSIEKSDLKRAIEECSNFRPERYTILEDRGVDYMIKCVDIVF